MLGSLILYLKGMRIMMFQLSGFYCNSDRCQAEARLQNIGASTSQTGSPPKKMLNSENSGV